MHEREYDDRPDATIESRDPLGRRQFLRGLAATGALAGTGGFLAACSSGGGSTGSSTSPTANGAPSRGGDLKVGLTGGSGSDTLDPHKGLTYLDTARAQSLFQPLLQLNTQAQAEFVLAEDISPHGSTSEWIIKVRKGITFHDGKPLTADDVIFTLRRIITGKLTGSTPLGPIDVKGLKAIDKHTVKVPMTSPYGSFLDQLAYWYYLYIVPVGFDPKNPNGTGPFKYKSFTPGQQSVFVKNPSYWKAGLPYVDTLTIIDFSDSASLQNALSTGVIHGAGALEGPQITALKANPDIRTVVSHTGAITPFTMRVDQPPFNDVRVRQAMRLLVNRPQLITSALNGYATVGSDVSSPYDPNYDTSLHRHLDIAQAKHLLKQAGQENLTVQLVTSPVATGTVSMATVLQQQAKLAGVTINLKTVDPTTFFGPNYLRWTFSQDFYNYSPYLAQVAQSLLPTSPFNETHWHLPKSISLYHQANATANASTRKQIEHEMQQIDFNEGGYIIPAFIDALDAYSTKITGYSAAKVGQPLSDFDFEHYSFA
ncbi:MAG TPA: ABC transporter substrate-binding protein [Streptosporangiaceae bacterium]|jgi:peptide/nickel transport system substrate-binding protein|nr:ABC transporter substrate-binding protein [Streptosporangiaceae bacterium]